MTAILPSSSKERAFTSLDNPSIQGACEVAAQFPGAACVVSDAGAVRVASPTGADLAEAIAREAEGSAAGGGLLRLVRQALLFSRPIGSRIALPRKDDPAGGPRSFEIAIVPCRVDSSGARFALIAGFETTLEFNLRKALIASRDLFRELVRCSADFAWETDAQGVLSFVGGRGAMGYAADALHGRLADSLIDPQPHQDLAAAPSESPFTTRIPVEDVEICLLGAGGQRHVFLISAVPLHDPGQVWRGARGVGRDVTALRRNERELARARARDELSRAIVDATLSERTFSDMLSAAARSLALTTKSDRAWVLCVSPGAPYDIGAAFGMIPHGTRHFLPPDLALPILEAGACIQFEAEGWQYLGAQTRLRGEVNGGICVARSPSSAPFDEETHALVALVARHTAVAITQATQLRALVDQTKSDELTGLANRRAFYERYERWLSAAGAATTSAVLYIDLDNFKRVNDKAGHGAGDALLRSFAGLLQRDSRDRDLPVRLGGDEFAVFVEGIAPDHVEERVIRLLRASSDIPIPEAAGGGSLRMSIGVAIITAGEREPAEAALERADGALYKAKRNGKAGLVIAEPYVSGGESPQC